MGGYSSHVESDFVSERLTSRFLGARLVLLLFASQAGAQSRGALVVYAGAATADLTSTYRFLNVGGYHEVNPLSRWLSDRPKTLVGYSAVLDAAGIYAARRVLGNRHSKLLTVALYSAAVIRVGLTVHNTRLLGR